MTKRSNIAYSYGGASFLFALVVRLRRMHCTGRGGEGVGQYVELVQLGLHDVVGWAALAARRRLPAAG